MSKRKIVDLSEIAGGPTAEAVQNKNAEATGAGRALELDSAGNAEIAAIAEAAGVVPSYILEEVVAKIEGDGLTVGEAVAAVGALHGYYGKPAGPGGADADDDTEGAGLADEGDLDDEGEYDDAGAPAGDGTRPTGYCYYCGQAAVAPLDVELKDQEAANRWATENCDCDEAACDRDVRRAFKRLGELFKDCGEAAVDTLRAVAAAIRRDELEEATIKPLPGVRCKIRRNDKGILVVTRTTTSTQQEVIQEGKQ